MSSAGKIVFILHDSMVYIQREGLIIPKQEQQGPKRENKRKLVDNKTNNKTE